jgi:uncharacterized membrane protein
MPKNQFSKAQRTAIQGAIAAAELHTSGEIRVHVARQCKGDPMEEAIVVFEKLEMHQTKLRNGILFYLSLEDHKLAILGDKGINDNVPAHFWDAIRDKMIGFFKKGEFTEGLMEGIALAGQQLKSAFPYLEDDVDELSTTISFEE